jgi:prevent-host-death family protein
MGVLTGNRWQLQKAKNRLSEVVRKAREDGPQIITVHGSEPVVVVGADRHRKPSSRKGTLVDVFRRSPLVGIDLDLARSEDTGTEVEL